MFEAATPSSSSILTQASLEALSDYIAKGGVYSKRGRSYARNDAVQNLRISPQAIRAEVSGSADDAYETQLTFTGKNWRGSCTCPFGENCKHSYAVAHIVLNQARIAAATAAAAKLAPNPKPAKKSFRETWTPIVAEKLGRSLSPDEQHTLGQLNGLFHELRNNRRLYVSSLEHFGFPPLPTAQPYALAEPTAYLDEENRFPADPWQLWQNLSLAYATHGVSTPSCLDVMVARGPEQQALLAARIQARQLAHWRQLLTPLAVPATSTHSAAAKSEPAFSSLRLRLENKNWYFETTTKPGKPFKVPTKAVIHSLVGYRHTPTPIEHLAPAERLILTYLQISSRSISAGNAYDGLQGTVSASTLAAILDNPQTHAALVLADGAPWVFGGGSLHYELILADTAATRLRFTLVHSAGTPAPDAEHIYNTDQSLYRWRNQIYPGPAPLFETEAPAAILLDDQIRQTLRRGKIKFPASLNLNLRTLTPRLRLSLSLQTSYGYEYIYAHFSAQTDDPPTFAEWTPGGWRWKTPLPARRADDPLLEVDLVSADAIGSRLREFFPSWMPEAVTGSRNLTRNFPDEFTAWRETLPPGLEIFAEGELASLLAPPLRASLFTHIEPAAESRDWFDLQLHLRVEDNTLTPDELALLLKARGKWVRLPGKGYRRVVIDSDDSTRAALDQVGLDPSEVIAHGQPASHRLHALQLAPAASDLTDARLAAELRQRASELAAPEVAVPRGLNADLRPYQLEGLRFLAFLSANSFGGVLADDMGLGKTLQTLAWILHLDAARTADAAPLRILIVCPKSVMHGWENETARFAPGLRTQVFSPALSTVTENPLPTPAPKSRAKKTKPPAAAPTTLTIANYSQLRLNAGWFNATAWDAVILDEGQFIKNPASQVAATARALPARHRLVLTGTPIENRALDLWSLFAFAQPGLLGTQAAFRRAYADDDSAALGRLRRRTRHFLLRRTKGQVATDLPPRIEDDLLVDLEPAQNKLYQAELKRTRQQLLGIESDAAFGAARFNILASLLRLRQICCHPGLIDSAHRDLPSAKLDALIERLEELRDEGHQVLVFSQFVEMLELISTRLAASGVKHLLLTGKTENRAELVETFQNDRTQTVFLLSLRAAGFGLNLTAASYAVIFDPWWNPAVEAQAIDRAHRIGQNKTVVAYRLLARGTVEEKIRAMQREKSTLAGQIIQEESLTSVLDLDSLRQILA